MKTRKHSIKFTQPTLAQQHSKDEVDINLIMKRYIKTGVLDHVAKYQGQYTENTATEYQESLNLIIRAEEMFSELPASARKHFDNDPTKFLSFVENPENHSKLHELGLSDAPLTVPTPATPTPTPTTPEKTAPTPP